MIGPEGRGSVMPMASRAVMESADVAAAPPVQPGQVRTGVSITIKYQMIEEDDGDEIEEEEE